jgi:nickel/cobalt exporter
MTGLLNAGTAFLLGAMHALEPGHGKTAIASYMVGNKQAKNHLLTLVFSMALSHTFILLMIGVGMMFLFPLFDFKKAEYAIGIASSVILIGIGIYMLYKIKNNLHVCSGSCIHHNNIQAYPILKPTGNLKMANTPEIIHTYRTTALMGILSGGIPCPSAVAAFFIAGQTGISADSIWYLLLYVMGFTFVMLLVALLFTIIGKKFNVMISNYKFIEKSDLISAWLIIGVGISYLLYNSFSH